MEQKTMRVRLVEGEGDVNIEIALGSEQAGWAVDTGRFTGLVGPTPRANADALVSLTLPAAMGSLATRLEIDGSPSPRLMEATDLWQEISERWFPDQVSRVEIAPTEAPGVPDRPRGERVGLFFSAGVDSWHSLLKHRDEVTDLILVHGWDSTENDAVREQLVEKVIEVAEAFGKNLIQLKMAIRPALRQYVDLTMVAFGGMLAGIGHLFADHFRTIYIASSHDYAHLVPIGSHPMTDPLWSSERLDIVHDGCEARRIDKVVQLAQDPLALRTLRVCAGKKPGQYNCGRCEKCLRTKLALLAHDRLDQCQTLDNTVRPGDIARLRLHEPRSVMRNFYEETLEVLTQRGNHPDIEKVLRHVVNRSLRRYRWERWWWARQRSLRKRLPFLEYDPDQPR